MTKLKLLLTYLQNGIEEPCQKIPSIFSVFVAEASVILLDPSYDQYSAISNFLLESPPMNLKVPTAQISSMLSFCFTLLSIYSFYFIHSLNSLKVLSSRFPCSLF